MVGIDTPAGSGDVRSLLDRNVAVSATAGYSIWGWGVRGEI